jgi:hypothetical protein
MGGELIEDNERSTQTWLKRAVLRKRGIAYGTRVLTGQEVSSLDWEWQHSGNGASVDWRAVMR